MKASRGSFANVLLLAVGFVAACAMCEVAARRGFMLPYNPTADGWWRVNWLKRSAGYDSSRTSLVIDKFHPALGWTLRENLRNVKFPDYTVNSNSQGIRGLAEHSIEKDGRFRLVAIGDSLTFGEAVNDHETYAAVIERLVDNTEVLNMAVHGYGNDQQLLKLQLDGLKYKPDVILFGYYEEDIWRNRLSFRDYQKPHFSVVDDRLVIDNASLLSPEEFKSRFHLRILDYVNILMTKLREERIEAENVVRTKRILDRIYAEGRSIGAPVIQVFMPTPNQVRADESKHPGLFSYGCSAPGVICVDPTHAMNAVVTEHHNDPRLLRNHYSAELHDAIAEQVAAALRRAREAAALHHERRESSGPVGW